MPSEPFTNKGRRVMAGQLHPQTRFTMTYIEDLLNAFGRRPTDLRLMVCYYTAANGETDTRAFVDTLRDSIGALPPMTLVAKPMMHTPENTVEIWGVARG